MITETAERVKQVCLERIGDDLRAVIGYTSEGIESTYFRDDVNRIVSEYSIDGLYNPILAFHRNGWRLTGMFDHFGPPTATMQAYGDKLQFIFPIDEQKGIFVSVDRENAYIADLFSDVETLVRESGNGGC